MRFCEWLENSLVSPSLDSSFRLLFYALCLFFLFFSSLRMCRKRNINFWWVLSSCRSLFRRGRWSFTVECSCRRDDFSLSQNDLWYRMILTFHFSLLPHIAQKRVEGSLSALWQRRWAIHWNEWKSLKSFLGANKSLLYAYQATDTSPLLPSVKF